MSKVHILQSDGNGNYKVVLHTAMPSGNNTAGKSWKAVALAAGLTGSTVLTVGTAPGNIIQTEKDSITAGDTLEIVTNFLVDSGGATQASISSLADQTIIDTLSALNTRYKYYGYTQD